MLQAQFSLCTVRIMQTQTTSSTTVIFEQPLNDPIRICLRLEHLFRELNQHSPVADQYANRRALIAIVKTLSVIDRPDIKTKLSQMLAQLATTLGQLEQFPQVDSSRLQALLKKLDALILNLHHNHNRINNNLRSNEFLNQIRLLVGNPGGACDYTSPALVLWLNQPHERRLQQLHNWASEFNELQETVLLILKLTRESTPLQTVSCADGFYHQTLDSSLPCQMIRVKLPAELNIYPEFSAGKHRLNIRFVTPNYLDNGRPIQHKNTFEFKLSCCRV